MVYCDKGEIDRAIADFNTAVELRPELGRIRNKRGVAYYKKGAIDRAIEDYNTAIELRPDLAEAYTNRGVAWLHLKEWEKAKADLTTARDMGADIIASFQNGYKNVTDFNGKYGVQLPDDLATMLTPKRAIRKSPRV